MPTVEAFFQSDAFFRGLMGPFGSGKSSACCVEIGQRGIQQKQLVDGVRRSRWAVIRNCYDDQTEILTEKRGWVLFRELFPDDKVATLKDGKELTFEVPTLHYQAHYEGEMIGFDNDAMNFLVTPDHHLWTTKTFGRERIETPYRHETAATCYGTTYWRMKRDAEWVGEPTHETEAFFEFLGFWFAEGTAGVYPRPGVRGDGEPHRRLVVSQKKSVDYVRDLLRRAGFDKWGESDKGGGNLNFVMAQTDRAKELTDRLALCGKAKSKTVPHWIKQAPAAHLRAFLLGYIAGDGHLRVDEHDTTRAYTSSRELADDLQEIALRAGWAANVGTYFNEGVGWSITDTAYVVTFSAPSRYRPFTNRGWFKTQYDGMVYCVEVSSHVVYVRRSGKGLWCGQTYQQLSDTTIRTFLQWFPPYQFGDWTPSKHQYTIRALRAEGDDCGAEIEVLFRALDRPDQLGNLLSLDLTGAWVNEGREIEWTIFQALEGRVGRYPRQQDGGPTWSGVFSDTNAPDVDSEWFKFFEETDHSERVATLAEIIPGMTVENYRQLFKQPSGRSPQAENLANLPLGYYQRLAIGKDPEWIKVYVDGEYGFVVEGKPVWPSYNDTIHCPAEKKMWPRPLEGIPILRGWDFGLTPAVNFSQITPKGQWIVFDEMCATSMGADKFSDEVLDHSARRYPRFEFEDVGDPAGSQRAQSDEKTCFQILHAKGIDIEPALQTLEIRIESVARPLRTLVDGGYPQFVLHQRCKMLRRALMGGYHFRRLRISGERYSEAPEKNLYSHISDSLGYSGTRLFGAGLRQAVNPRRDRYDEAAINDRSRSSITGY